MNPHFLFIIACFLLLGTGTAVSKDAIAIVPPWMFMTLTLGIASVVAITGAQLIDRPRWFRLGARTYFDVFVQAMLGAELYTVFLLFGLTYSTAIAAGIVASITPAVTLILSFIFLRERLTLRKLIAILLACAALLLVSLAAGGSGSGAVSPIGLVLLILSVLSVSVFFIIAKYVQVDLPAATMTAGICGFSFVVSLAFSIPEMARFDWHSMTNTVWLETLYYAVGIWVLPFYFTFRGIHHVPASAVGMATALTPIATMVTAVLVYRATVTPFEGIALLAVVASIFIVETKHDNRNLDVLVVDEP